MSKKINVLVVGSGGRDFALGWKCAKSPLVEKVFFAPGNAGTTAVGTNLLIDVTDFQKMKEAVNEHNITMIISGPEVPLCAGLHDFFESVEGVHVIGPKTSGAKLESSKDFSKQFMARNNIPTASYQSFKNTEVDEAKKYLETLTAPYVLKADGLAGGKGVLIINELEEAKVEVEAMLTGGKFGGAGNVVVIEEFMSGDELSFFILIDSKGNYQILPTAMDFKRAADGDQGLNTGGMGALTPTPFCKEGSDLFNKVESEVVKPVIKALLKEKLNYTGFLYIGLMNTPGNIPKVVEFNCRMGDPECEGVMVRIENDIVPAFLSLKAGTLNEVEPIKYSPFVCTTVIIVAQGYPQSYSKGMPISFNHDKSDSSIVVFHSGTSEKNGEVVASGGRVIAVTARGEDFKKATTAAYKAVEKITFEGAFFRKDIGKKFLH